jgi:hypothetical protein
MFPDSNRVARKVSDASTRIRRPGASSSVLFLSISHLVRIQGMLSPWSPYRSLHDHASALKQLRHGLPGAREPSAAARRCAGAALAVATTDPIPPLGSIVG